MKVLATVALRTSRHSFCQELVGATDASRLSNVKFLAAFETDLIRPPLDRKHAAHLLVTTPEDKSEDRK